MRRLLCKLGFHRWRKAEGVPGIYFFYWTERCEHCAAERTDYEAIK